MRFGLAACLAALILAAPAAARADASGAPDLVRLKDGSMFRGTIAELVANDHVVIVTASGESKRFAMSDVAFAGPTPAPAAGPAAPPPAAPPPSPDDEKAHVALEANVDDVTFQLKTGQAEMFGTGFVGSRAVMISGQATAYSTICTAPCTTTLPVGTHHIGLSQGSGRVIEPEGPITITGPGKLEGTYTSRAGIRVAGYVLMISSIVAGTVITYEAIQGNKVCDPPLFAGDQPFCHNDPDMTLAGVGLGVMLGGALIGLALAWVKDDAQIQFVPGGVAPAAKAGSREGLAFDSRGLVFRF